MVTRKTPIKKKPVKKVEAVVEVVEEPVEEIIEEPVVEEVPVKNGDVMLPRRKSRYKSMNI